MILNNGMRKIFTLLLLIILLQMTSCKCPDCNYKIYDSGGVSFCTKSYVMDDNGCIEFISLLSNNNSIERDSKIKICGTYKIIKQPQKNK